MVKSLEEYQALSVRTMKEDSHLMKILHCTMGMVGEVGELMELEPGLYDKYFNPIPDMLDKIKGELGDCMWYLANLYHLLQRPFPQITISDQGIETNDLIIAAAELTDLVKKSVFYGKSLDEAKAGEIADRYLCLIASRTFDIEVDLYEVLEANVKKLEKRYPNLCFNADHAINRDYAAESEAAGIKIACP